MLQIIRATKKRKEFVEEYMAKILPKAKIVYDHEQKKDSSGFVELLGSLEESATIIEDDQFITEKFEEKSLELIERHPNDVICFSQIKMRKNSRPTEGFDDPMKISTFALYIPMYVGKEFAKWYEEIENQKWGEYYNAALARFLKSKGKQIFYSREALTGHDISQSSAYGHRSLYPTIGFDYEKAFNEYCAIMGRDYPLKRLLLKAKLSRFEER